MQSISKITTKDFVGLLMQISKAEDILEYYVEQIQQAKVDFYTFDSLNPREKLQYIENLKTLHSAGKVAEKQLKAEAARRDLIARLSKELTSNSVLINWAFSFPLSDLKKDSESYITEEELAKMERLKKHYSNIRGRLELILEDYCDESIAGLEFEKKIREHIFRTIFTPLYRRQLKRVEGRKKVKEMLKNVDSQNFRIIGCVDFLDADLRVKYYNSFSLEYENNETDDDSYEGVFIYKSGEVVLRLDDILNKVKVENSRWVNEKKDKPFKFHTNSTLNSICVMFANFENLDGLNITSWTHKDLFFEKLESYKQWKRSHLPQENLYK